MLNLYTETAFVATPPTPNSLIILDLPSSHGSRSITAFKKQRSGAGRVAQDEQSFAREHLASAGSIYCRQSKRYPRTFLWRVVGDEHILQVQSADTARSAADQHEAYLTLHFNFHEAIIPNGVALADTDTSDVLTIFVLTAGKELYTLSLNTAWFRTKDAIPQDFGHWCHRETPSAFTIDQPHLLHANNPHELFASFESGRLLRLTRRADEESWRQEHYDDRTWGASIRGIVGRHGARSITYQSRHLDPATAHAVTATTDSTHLFTVCLNHSLRVWSLTTGKLILTKDLLNKQREQQDSVFLNPAEKCIVRLVRLEHISHQILLTYSPHEGGQFKFWFVKGGLTSPLTVEDRYPGVTLSPPDPDPSGNTVWSLTDFGLRLGNESKPSELWILWRNNNYHRLYSLSFDFAKLPESWASDWVQTVQAPFLRHSLPDLISSDPVDITSKWLDFFFLSGRYSLSVLETALAVYQSAVSQQPSATQRKRSLAERMCNVMAANVTLRKYAEADMDYSRFSTDTNHQWRTYWRIVESINEGRQAPISLCVDNFSGMIWLLMAGFCCAVRESSNLELITYNKPDELHDIENKCAERWSHRRVTADSGESFSRMSSLLSAAAGFRRSFPAGLATELEIALEEEYTTEAELPIPARLYELYERVNFGEAINSEIYNRLEQDLVDLGGMSGLNTEMFFAIFERLPQQSEKPESALRNTLFSSDMITAGLRDTFTTRRQMVSDLLALVVFVEGEMGQEEEEPLDFSASELFARLLLLLQEYDRDLWLVTHTRQTALEILGPHPAPNASRSLETLSPDEARTVTILEDAVGKAIRPQPFVEKPQSYVLTNLLLDIEGWISGQDEISAEDKAVFIQCDLLAQQNIDLASKFDQYQPSTAWARYVKGRLCLSRGENAAAALYFQKAAFNIAHGKPPGTLSDMSAGLVRMIDLNSFYNGLPRYYHHLVSLFESSKAFSQATEFANLALEALQTNPKQPDPALRSELLSRLFIAELKCSNFGRAYNALVQFTDQALQKSSITALINAILEPQSVACDDDGKLEALQQLPIALHPRLSRHVMHHLEALARKQLASRNGSRRAANSFDTDYLKILYTMRLTQDDYRGAVSVLFERLQVIRKAVSTRADPQATDLRHAFLALINAMSCAAPEEAYILTDADVALPMVEADSQPEQKRKRVIVTLEDLRRDYQQLLDRCSRIERGDFAFELDSDSEEEDGMEVDGDPIHGEVLQM